MPPIPIRSNDPIYPNVAAAKADGVTPQTATPEESHPAPTQTTTAPTATWDPDAPPSPQPGPVPVPPTTSRAKSTATNTPPPPRPGAVPRLPSASLAPQEVTKTIMTTETRQGYPTAPPVQMNYAPPSVNQAPTFSTSTSHPQPAQTRAGPTTLNLGPGSGTNASQSQAKIFERQSLEHPPGYVQNPYANEGTRDQRNALHDAAERESGNSDGGVWNAVMGAVGRAGEGLRHMEEKAWRSVK